LRHFYRQKGINIYGPSDYVSAPTATNDYYSYNTNNTFPCAANLVQNIDATEAMKQAEGEEGGGNGLVESIINYLGITPFINNW
jgi:hypothetical protein